MAFCQNCGNQLADDQVFCPACGTKNGAAKSAAPSNLPPIIGNIVTTTKKFFTTKDQAQVVADSAKDTSWSGALVALLGIILYGVSMMIYFGQAYIQYIKKEAKEADASAKYIKEIIKAIKLPNGACFGLSVLLAFLVFAFTAVAVFVAVKCLLKKDITFAGAVNIVAYAALPLIGIAVLNMVFALISWTIAAALALITYALWLILICEAVRINAGEDRLPTFAVLAIIAVAVIIFVIFLGINYNVFQDGIKIDY